MSVRSLIILGLAAIGCGTTQPWIAMAAQPAPDTRSVDARIAAVEHGLVPPVIVKGRPIPLSTIEERMRFYNAPGLSIAVINNGQIEWARGYGVVQRGGNERVTEHTMFAAGSISKPVTAMAALRLVQEGRLDLNQNVNERLTSWRVPENEFTAHEKVTLRRILNHTSGLGLGAGDGRPGDTISIVEALSGGSGLGGQPSQVGFTPGARQQYSSVAYGLLGLLLQDATGSPTADVIESKVLEPLGMSDSLFAQVLPESHWSRAAVGHNSRTGEPLPRNQPSSPALGAAGMWSTPTDLARFAIELQRARAGEGGGRVLSQTMARLMTVPSRGGWSLGLNVDTSGDTPFFYHDGSVPGFTSYMVAFNTRGQGAVVMVNEDMYNGLKLLNEVMLGIAEVYGWSDFGPIERVTIPARPRSYSGYEGTYEIDEGYPITLVARGGKLHLIWALGSVFEMHQDGPDSFFIVREGAPSYSFTRNESGAVTGITRRWNGGEQSAPRVPLPAPSRGRRVFRLEGHQDALIVSLVGGFNDWRLQRTICAKERGGWTCRADLPAGEHLYAFLVDGRQIADPARSGTATSPDGGPASTIRIGR